MINKQQMHKRENVKIKWSQFTPVVSVYIRDSNLLQLSAKFQHCWSLTCNNYYLLYVHTSATCKYMAKNDSKLELSIDGLSTEESNRRLAIYGKNVVEERVVSEWKQFALKFWGTEIVLDLTYRPYALFN